MRGDHDRRHCRVSRVSFIYHFKGLIMEGLFAIALYIGVFFAWAYGVAICWAANELFWAVVSFSFFPVGVIIGVYNVIF